MKLVGQTFISLAFVGLFGLMLTARSMKADPSDDFSFSLHRFAAEQQHQVVSEWRVIEILSDRLRSFPKDQVPKLARHLIKLSKQYRFDPAFILSVIQVESSFRARVVSYAGAVGLMQVMPGTAAVISKRIEHPDAQLFQKAEAAEVALKDPYLNLELGIAYLGWLRDRYRHLSPYYLVAAYNLGPYRLDELRSRKSFKPASTKRYYEAIRRRVPEMRFYRRSENARQIISHRDWR